MNRRLVGLLTALGGRPRRRNPFLLVHRLRYEIAVAGAALGLAQLGAATHHAVPSAVVLAAVVVLAGFPGARAWLRGRCLVVLVQHRLRSAFAGAGLRSLSGRAPAILWTTPRPAGVRVVVSLPAGLEAADVQALRQVLAAACFASDVLVERHERHANLVVLLVVTRVPAP